MMRVFWPTFSTTSLAGIMLFAQQVPLPTHMDSMKVEVNVIHMRGMLLQTPEDWSPRTVRSF